MQFLIEFLDALLHSEQFFESAKFQRFAEDTTEHIVRPGPHPPKCGFWQNVFIGPRSPTFRRSSNDASGGPWGCILLHLHAPACLVYRGWVGGVRAVFAVLSQLLEKEEKNIWGDVVPGA